VRDLHHYLQSTDVAELVHFSLGFSNRVQCAPVPQPPEERRKVSRVKLSRPLSGQIGAARVYLVDASVEGIRIAHQGAISVVGQSCRVSFDWEGRSIELVCQVIHNSLFRLAKTAEEKSIYHAGLRIAEATGDSRAVLRQLVADCVARALDEQKANARGIPAAAVQAFQTGKGNDFIRCELVEGTWRRTATNRSEQPVNGFTISAEEERDQVEMLCQTFQSADAAGRKLIQAMAEMSISKSEGVPTRRYNP
jgi:hypothetical protein